MKRGKTITWLENYKKRLSHQFKINRKRTETLEHHKSTTMSYKFLKYLIRIDIREEKQVNVFLAQRFQDAAIGVKTKDRYYHGRVYKKCFVATDAIDWLVENTTVETRDQALTFGIHLQNCGFISPVNPCHDLSDATKYFRFNKHFEGGIPPFISGSETARQREIVAEKNRPQSPIRNLIKRASAILKKMHVAKKPAEQEIAREPASVENPFSPRKVVFRFPETEPTPPVSIYDICSQVLSEWNFSNSESECYAEMDVSMSPVSSAASLPPPSILLLREGEPCSLPVEAILVSPASLQRVYSNLYALPTSCSSFRDVSFECDAQVQTFA
jgi:hypothetical protein